MKIAQQGQTNRFYPLGGPILRIEGFDGGVDEGGSGNRKGETGKGLHISNRYGSSFASWYITLLSR